MVVREGMGGCTAGWNGREWEGLQGGVGGSSRGWSGREWREQCMVGPQLLGLPRPCRPAASGQAPVKAGLGLQAGVGVQWRRAEHRHGTRGGGVSGRGGQPVGGGSGGEGGEE